MLIAGQCNLQERHRWLVNREYEARKVPKILEIRAQMDIISRELTDRVVNDFKKIGCITERTPHPLGGDGGGGGGGGDAMDDDDDDDDDDDNDACKLEMRLTAKEDSPDPKTRL